MDETVEAFEEPTFQSKIRHWGVSNFDVADLQELDRPDCAANQILYNLEARGIEFDLLPWCRERDLPVMEYSPIGQGASMLGHRTFIQVAQGHDATPAQIALVSFASAAGHRHSQKPAIQITYGPTPRRRSFGSLRKIWPTSILPFRLRQRRNRSRCSDL